MVKKLIIAAVVLGLGAGAYVFAEGSSSNGDTEIKAKKSYECACSAKKSGDRKAAKKAEKKDS